MEKPRKTAISSQAPTLEEPQIDANILIRLLQVAIGRDFEAAEVALLKTLIQDPCLNFQAVADKTGYQMYYLRGQVGPRLWADFTEVFGRSYGAEIGKRNFGDFIHCFSEKLSLMPNSFLQQDLEQHQIAQIFEPGEGEWAIAPLESWFYGRSKELDSLGELLSQYRLVALIGDVGVGKTALAARWTERFGAKSFDRVIWKSIAHAPEPDILLNELLQEFEVKELPQKLSEKMSALMQIMKQQRCFIVLDSAESLIKTTAITAINPYTSPDYGRMIRFFAEEPHQSSLLFISRRRFNDVLRLSRANRATATMRLEGLQPKDAQRILEAHGLKNSSDWQRLIQIYAGNPEYLISISGYIQTVFSGNVQEFLRCNTVIVPDVVCQEYVNQIQEINAEHRALLFHLAALKDPVHFDQLVVSLTTSMRSQSALIKAINDLAEMNLIEKQQNNALLFGLNPIVKKVILSFPFTDRC